MPVTMLQGIAVSYYNSMNNHTTKMRMPNTHIFLSRSAIKYAVNIYQALPNNTSRQRWGRMLAERDHWGIWWLPDLTISVHVTSALIRLVWILLPAVYHCLPNITRGPFWLYPAHGSPLPGPASARRHNT